MISPLGFSVPKKVTARKQNPSASPGSGNFRDTLFNILRAQPPPRASAAAQVGHSTSHSKVLGWDKIFGGQEPGGKGQARAVVQPAGRGCRRDAVVTPAAREGVLVWESQAAPAGPAVLC